MTASPTPFFAKSANKSGSDHSPGAGNMVPASAAMPSGREIRIEGKIAYVPLTRGRTAVSETPWTSKPPFSRSISPNALRPLRRRKRPPPPLKDDGG